LCILFGSNQIVWPRQEECKQDEVLEEEMNLLLPHLFFKVIHNLGEMLVVEAISENGEIAYKEFGYSVEKKKR